MDASPTGFNMNNKENKIKNKIYYIFPSTLIGGLILGYFMDSITILSTVFFAFVVGSLAVLRKVIFK